MKRWLSLSKKIAKNPLGEWGSADSSNVRVKGMRDYAYLVIKRHGSPMHFTEVAKSISELFNRKAHVATCHNELIKYKRFVLVGRGLYALAEWGYTSGVVKEVIADILRKYGPLTREEVALLGHSHLALDGLQPQRLQCRSQLLSQRGEQALLARR